MHMDGWVCQINTSRPKPDPDDAAAASNQKYDGPDSDLVNVMERDMLDSSPGVSWDDIAGLTDAKRVLQEATVLPLIVPEFFTGIRRPVKVPPSVRWSGSASV